MTLYFFDYSAIGMTHTGKLDDIFFQTLINKYFKEHQDHPILSKLFDTEHLGNYGDTSRAMYAIYETLFYNKCFDVIEEIIEQSNFVTNTDCAAICLHAVRTDSYQILNLLNDRGFLLGQDIISFMVVDISKTRYIRVGVNALGYAIHCKNLPMCKFLIEEIGIKPFSYNVEYSRIIGPKTIHRYDSMLNILKLNNEIIDYFWQFDIPQLYLEMFLIRTMFYFRSDKKMIDKIIDKGLDLNEIDQTQLQYCLSDSIQYLFSLGLNPKTEYVSIVCSERLYKHLDILLESGYVLNDSDMDKLFYGCNGSIIEILKILIKYRVDMSKLVIKSNKENYLLLGEAEDLGLDRDMFLQYLVSNM